MLTTIYLHHLKVFFFNVNGFVIFLFPSQHPKVTLTAVKIAVIYESKTQKNESCSQQPQIFYSKLEFSTNAILTSGGFRSPGRQPSS